MGMPNLTDNYQGYDEGDLSKHVDQLKDKQFLLVSSIAAEKISSSLHLHDDIIAALKFSDSWDG